jgi:hypothetical protein
LSPKVCKRDDLGAESSPEQLAFPYFPFIRATQLKIFLTTSFAFAERAGLYHLSLSWQLEQLWHSLKEAVPQNIPG